MEQRLIVGLALCFVSVASDDEISAAIAKLRADGAAPGSPMDHIDDAEVLKDVQQALASMPTSTAAAFKEQGLKRLAPVLARFARSASDTSH